MCQNGLSAFHGDNDLFQCGDDVYQHGQYLDRINPVGENAKEKRPQPGYHIVLPLRAKRNEKSSIGRRSVKWPFLCDSKYHLSFIFSSAMV